MVGEQSCKGPGRGGTLGPGKPRGPGSRRHSLGQECGRETVAGPEGGQVGVAEMAPKREEPA